MRNVRGDVLLVQLAVLFQLFHVEQFEYLSDARMGAIADRGFLSRDGGCR